MNTRATHCHHSLLMRSSSACWQRGQQSLKGGGGLSEGWCLMLCRALYRASLQQACYLVFTMSDTVEALQTGTVYDSPVCALMCVCACRLRAKGFSAFIAGGWVRDVYLQRRAADIDIATSASPAQVRRIFLGDPMVDLPRSTVKLTHQGEVRRGG